MTQLWQCNDSGNGQNHINVLDNGHNGINALDNGHNGINEVDNGHNGINKLVNVHMQKEIRIVEIPTNLESALSPPSFTHQTKPFHNPPLVGPIPINLHKPDDLDPTTHHFPKPVTQPELPSYRVELPENDADSQSIIIPIAGLSPVSAVTSGLNRIHLKHHQDPLEEDLVLNPTKK